MDTWGLVELPTEEEEYRAWLQANQHGYVINDWKDPIGKPADAIGMRWHRADCGFVAPEPDYRSVSGDTLKACSTDLSALAAWAVLRMREYDEPLYFCKPCRER